jgi:hypothetical protein
MLLRRFAGLLSAAALGCGGQTGGTSHDAGTSRDASADVRQEAAPSNRQNARLIQFCGAITSCGITLGAPDEMGDCVGLAGEVLETAFLPSVVKCVLASNQSCGAVKLCFNDGRTFDACRLHDKLACLGNIVEFCDPYDDSGTTWSVECAAGTTCSVPGGGCNYGLCSGPPYSCAGTTVRSCDPVAPDAASYLHFNDECTTATTATCGPGPDGGATCIGTGPACTEDRCEGTTLVSCQGGHEAPYDCASVGLLCIDAGNDGGETGNTGVYCALGNDCGLLPHPSCDGDVLHFCNEGLLASVNCATSGWGHCVSLPDFGGTGCQR